MKRLLLGPHAVAEALRAAPGRLSVIYADVAGGGAHAALSRLAREQQVRWESRARPELDAIARGARHQGLLAISGEYPYLSLHALLEGGCERPLLVALDQITDPHNFGAIIRSAVALGADGIVTLKDRAAPVTPAVVRASAGASELARIARVTNLARTLTELREAGMQIVGLSPDAPIELPDAPAAPDAGRVLVVGSEGSGLRKLVKARCDVLARIHLCGSLQSLNASVAAGIAIYESVRRPNASR
jgi:23S rRNA (guanosine2251-2'-O)-methyltransferase